ncbi:23S rRNA (uracil(1939)-C(5))-methyltransferase RlmD [Halomonas sp. TRM85114]|uniref:23S rRNA (uracil(1939)-C(5))-methyltransferase RlmD n=1 Tax=Halomonas jincaotanensis TaxID=2810616 RepID=UPI001BD47E30|nr:23S rRNA (uracil(1939)-C(5))-methyltransferase RlmD [Halomonas jincaotanensis]MBS9402177.1 23S rRNA (uracil(1939)-C(5))-methyltransferase RlmD [Halomonas jincaotanensis]
MVGLGKRRPSRARSGVSGLQGRHSSPAEYAATTRSVDDGLIIERLAHDGRGVAHIANGKTQFVEGALPGERVETAIHLTRQRYDETHVRRVIEASPDRTTPPCIHYALCGGCDLQHLAIEAQRGHKLAVLQEMLSRQGIELTEAPTLIATDDQHYRRRARLGVKVDAEGRVHLGFRARRSQRLVDISDCTILVPSLNVLLGPLHDQVATLEAPRQLGHLELLESDQGVVLVLRQLKEHAADARRWQAFAEMHGLHIVRWLGRDTPVLDWLTLPPALTYRLPGPGPGTGPSDELTLGFAPGDFLQANAAVNRRLIETAMVWLGNIDGRSWLDLFAGVGNFSVSLAARGAIVTAVEGNVSMVERLADNARINGLDVVSRQADLTQTSTIEALLSEYAPEAVLLDPPRAGAERVCQTLVEHPVARILYVACDPATLSRDAARLVHGGYRIVHAAVADMFVHTSHLESMLLLEHPRKQW